MQGGHARVDTDPYGTICSEPGSGVRQELTQLRLYRQLNGDETANVLKGLPGFIGTEAPVALARKPFPQDFTPVY